MEALARITSRSMPIAVVIVVVMIAVVIVEPEIIVIVVAAELFMPPAVPADAAAPAKTHPIGIAAPIPAGAMPAVRVPAIVVAAEAELHRLDQRADICRINDRGTNDCGL